MAKERAGRNRTLSIDSKDIQNYSKDLLEIHSKTSAATLHNRLAHNDFLKIFEYLPEQFADLIIADPPYNLNKKFGNAAFSRLSIMQYSEYVESWLSRLKNLLKPGGSLYICSDWFTSTSIHLVAEKYFKVRNRITWEREKGRGAKTNWKNSSEDIWFLTKDENYFFNVEAVKMKKRVLAPYRENGNPKDWQEEADGKFRMTSPSNLWNDITIPYWSMPENTDHPTQKPEKLIAKLILASSKPNDLVFDPFLGSGTTAVVAKKLGRNFFGCEINQEYLTMALKRLALADKSDRIQGYENGVFFARNESGSAK